MNKLMNKSMRTTIGLSAAIVFVASLAGLARSAGEPDEQERKVKAAEVPAPVLDALKKLAGDKKITEFSEEIEHGKTYYEGSWKTTDGKIDALVTPTGDLVEIEQGVSADNVPKPVLKQARKTAGKNAKLYFEKKTIIMYEVHFRKDGRRHELVLSPDGRQQKDEDEQGDEYDDD